MKRKWIWLLIPVVVLVLGLGLAWALVPRSDFVWVDPPPPDNSLSLEAQRKLSPAAAEVPPPKAKPEKSASKNRAPKTAPTALRSPKGPYIVIDTHTNRIYWRTTDSVLFSALCSTGTGGELVDTVGGREWRFNTPRGVFSVDSRLTDPWWRKPDWAFIEEGTPIPKKEEERYDPEVMGEYAIGFGNGFFIHGTLYERLIGVSVTHGCVRLAAPDLEYLYPKVRKGTPVVIF